MSQDTINREVGPQSKGFRLQKLRAIRLLLDELEKPGVSVFVAIECQDDVYMRSSQGDQVWEYTESDKNFASKNSFTFMSSEVKNSLISFLDCWIYNKMSDSLYFGFYTNIDCGKERQSETTEKLSVTLPSKPILEILMNEPIEDTLLNDLKKVVIAEYEEQYKKKDNGGKSKLGNLPLITSFTNDIWRDFFSKIRWQFGQEDDDQLEKALIDKIRGSSIYPSVNLGGREKYVLAGLEILIDKKQKEPHFHMRLIDKSDVQVAFLEVASGVYKSIDPIHQIWEGMEPPDKRSINEKVLSVCKSYDSKKLERIARKIASIKIELNNLDSKDRGSLKYRVYEACEEKLSNLITKNADQEITALIVDDWLGDLSDVAQSHLKDKGNDFTYPLNSQDSVRKIVLELFDSCYLAFDEEV